VITCRDCVRALYPYIDRELSDDDIEHVKEHLDACGGCLHLYQFEASLRRLVKVRCQEQQAPASLRERITLTFALECATGAGKRRRGKASPQTG
jgi:mycothiol system anti-sigma-R factor